MSEIVDQIEKLKAKAHSLKEGVSINPFPLLSSYFMLFRENIWKLLKSLMSLLLCRRKCMEISPMMSCNPVRKQPSFAIYYL